MCALRSLGSRATAAVCTWGPRRWCCRVLMGAWCWCRSSAGARLGAWEQWAHPAHAISSRSLDSLLPHRHDAKNLIVFTVCFHSPVSACSDLLEICWCQLAVGIWRKGVGTRAPSLQSGCARPSQDVGGAGACWCRCCELAVHTLTTGCRQ